ncbi:hypothetical protein Q3G72_013129 [Acer saccharum]|nr:hypothetical protein Q3G72_013129 [Acer saccharum]
MHHGERGTNGYSMTSDGEGKESFHKAGLGKNRTFVEMVTGNKSGCVNEDADGDVKVLVLERDSFVMDSSIWKDRFSSMMNGSESFKPSARLVWIFCFGVPVRFWKKAFFINIVRLFGDPILVDEDTLFKKRLEKGRMLVLIPYCQSCPNKIKVSVGNDNNNVLVEGASFPVKLNEDLAPADAQWLVKVLGLKTSGKGNNLNSLQLLDSVEALDKKVTCKLASFASDQNIDSLEKGRVSFLVKHKVKEGSKRSACQGLGMKLRSSKNVSIGVAVGFDFNVKKVKMANIVAKAYSKLMGIRRKMVNVN